MSVEIRLESKPSLATVELFNEFPDAVWEDLERHCCWRTVPANKRIIGHLDESKDVFFLVSGEARVLLYSQNGKEVTFRELSEGSIFGELAAIDGQARSATVIAKKSCVLATLSAAQFTELLETNPLFVKAMMRHFVRQIRSLTERVYEFSTLNVSSRLHAELLRLSARGMRRDGSAKINNVPTHEEIASRISTHRQAVSTELKRLEKAGIIRREGKAIIVNDVSRLEQLIAQAKT